MSGDHSPENKRKDKLRYPKLSRDHRRSRDCKRRKRQREHEEDSYGKGHRSKYRRKHRRHSKDKHRQERDNRVKYELYSGFHNHRNDRKRTTDSGEEVVQPKKTKLDSDVKGKVSKEPDTKQWTEKSYADGTKWHFLEHKGPVFHPEYQPLPSNVSFCYNGQPMKLSPGAEEVATFFAKMLDHECVNNEIFRENFFKDWRSEMTEEERDKIKDLSKCNFRAIKLYLRAQTRRPAWREQKRKLEELENERLLGEYGFCIMDGRKERITNFRTEPPGLFRGIKGDHPKSGLLRRRVRPEDCIINCSQDSEWPRPPPGTTWKEVRHDNRVSWLVAWEDNITGYMKYISTRDKDKLKVKGEKEWENFETARKLKQCVDRIRVQYRNDWRSDQLKVRQRAVALYLVDRLALGVDNEEEEGEMTVGCCSLRVEHVTLHLKKDGKLYVVELDFPGYYNAAPVEKRVFKNFLRFMLNKKAGDYLFDRITAALLNQHLQELMAGLTAKVFRTHNASVALQQQLAQLTQPRNDVPDKILSYNRAHRAMAALCHHQRAPPKSFEASVQKLLGRIAEKREELSFARREAEGAEADAREQMTEQSRNALESKNKAVLSLESQLRKLEAYAADRDRRIAPRGAKLSYLDPRITVAWCKRFGVPIEKIYNKELLERFDYFIDMVDQHFEF